MIFFGTQPTLTQVPPRRPDSARTTRAPYSAARWAAASPPLPPPITTRSNFSAMTPSRTAACPHVSEDAPLIYEAARIGPHAADSHVPTARPGQPWYRKGRYNGARSTGRGVCMDNPLLGQEPLPQFMRIRPEHVEPAVRELLSA